MMFQDHDPTTGYTGGATPPRDPDTGATASEPEPPGEPRIRATLHEPMRWKQLFRDAVTLTLDTLDDAGDRMGRELGLRGTQPDANPRPDDAA